MKLLIITQTVDQTDPTLGFFHRWIEEFAKNCEQVTVVALGVGEYNLPDNVKVLSLGKEEGPSRLKYLWNFYKYLWRERQNYDTVLVHMNQIYLLLAGGLWRIMGKKIGFWYTHKNVGWQLRVAEKFADIIFTASPESFRLASKKVRVVGHGIDVERFICPTTTPNHDGPLHIISVGRITRIKDLQTLIMAVAILKNKITRPLRIDLIGGVVTADDRQYRDELGRLVVELGVEKEVNFVGPVKPDQLPAHYCGADLSVNLCPTGGMDKAVLESLAAGLPVLVSNQAFGDYFGLYQGELIFKQADEHDLAEKIIGLTNRQNLQSIKDYLQSTVRERSDLSVLIKKIVATQL